MILFKNSQDFNARIKEIKAKNLRVGFVPTMGALHAGHLSLIKLAKQKCDIVVCSIFVNPTQFNVLNDLHAYPKPIEKDIQLLIEEGCDILFHPEVSDIYGEDFKTDSAYDYGSFIHILEGATRPGHFDGVITIVKRLFLLSEPDEVFFGQKDYQQCLVVRMLIQRNFPQIGFNLCSIEREEDGLAMSSRNIRLSEAERKVAPQIYAVLIDLKENWGTSNWEKSFSSAKLVLGSAQFELDYLCVCKADTLEVINIYEANAIVLVAVQLGKTRLIDNLLL